MSVSERFERSRIGRALISIGVVVLLLAEVGTHLPSSALERAVREPSDLIVRLAGSEQTWAVFAPDPRAVSLRLEARITFADGSAALWKTPEGPAIGANLRFYRWRKWIERARADDHSGLWDPTARWIASLYEDGPSPVVQVDLIRRFHQNVVSGEQPEWKAFTYYTLYLSEPAG